ncbi:hypothetical protein CF138_17260 [Aeromonas hydrophila]|uniref:hypothetical protein n=1 Tax=Aeromonas hydrophila TaxID=644 RepID=UPI001116A821|nr:hypothetical protein [Aeromonas hydrophila]TNH82849.1 hypothetical protein CF138_17260 [Aeromonas hydrophila]TNI00234.1 hypothetical protein CF136_10565 [Aeromonas hydrophila]TNI92885.1 hypothetical protein CF118_18075 [Aeromonas hydrophila]
MKLKMAMSERNKKHHITDVLYIVKKGHEETVVQMFGEDKVLEVNQLRPLKAVLRDVALSVIDTPLTILKVNGEAVIDDEQVFPYLYGVMKDGYFTMQVSNYVECEIADMQREYIDSLNAPKQESKFNPMD